MCKYVGMPVLIINKKAKHDYHILETYEAGLVLSGHEVKAIREGKISIKGAHVAVIKNEMTLIGAQISPYQPKNTPENYDSSRSRRLLLHKKQIKSLIGKTKEKGLTLIPLRVYTKHGRLKIEIGLARGKRKPDKRETIKKKEVQRKIKRAFNNKGDARHR